MADAPRCKGCGKASLAPLEGADWSCTRCGLIQTLPRWAVMPAGQREDYARRGRARRRAFAALGLCPRCGAAPEPGRKLCRRHLDYLIARDRKKRAARQKRGRVTEGADADVR